MARTKMMNNLDAVGEAVGALMGIADGLEEDEYIESLVRDAHGKAAKAFDVAAAAAGAAGHLTHVFEFGTAGITRGQPKFMDPTSEAARLWTHKVTGTGGNLDIGYTFRPALNRNPIPTTRDTGVPSKYLRRISKRKYVFWNKAFVMETGQTVEIHAKRGNYLFVPFNNEAPRNPLNRKGFVMWNTKRQGPIMAQPGRTTKGTFTAFWMRWWASQGEEVMAADMMKNVEYDTKKAEKELAKRANSHPVKPAAANNPLSVAKRARFTAKQNFGRGRASE